MLGGDFAVESAVVRLTHTLGRPWPWLRPLARRYIKAFANHTRPRHSDVVQFLRHDLGLRRVWDLHHRELPIKHWLTEPQQMQPIPAASSWLLPSIETPQALADWLLVELSELQWYADLKGIESRSHSTQVRKR
jgi:RNA-directed DNA polymerase